MGEFVCVDWSGEAGTGSEGEVGQQGGVLGVVLAAPRRVPRQPDVNKTLLSLRVLTL